MLGEDGRHASYSQGAVAAAGGPWREPLSELRQRGTYLHGSVVGGDKPPGQVVAELEGVGDGQNGGGACFSCAISVILGGRR